MKLKRMLAVLLVAALAISCCACGKPADNTPPVQTAEQTPEVTATPEAEATPEVTATPEAEATPEVTATPEAEATPEATATPEAEATPEVTATPEAEATPEATATPEAEATPEVTAAPEAEATPEVTATPEAEATPEVTPTPEVEQAPATVADILAKMEAALAGNPCSKMDMDIVMKLDMSAPEFGTMNMDMTIGTETTVSQQPLSGYVVSTVDIGVAGGGGSTVSESYLVTENGALVSYTNAEGIWLRVPAEQTPEELMSSTDIARFDPAAAVLVEELTTWEGKEAICIDAVLSGDTMQSVVDEMVGEVAEPGSAVDYSAMTCYIRMYLDKATYLPLAQDVRFEGMDEVMASAMGDMGVDVSVSECTALARFVSYAPQSEIKLPADVKEKAAAWECLIEGEPDNGDGTYTIREDLFLVDVAVTEGFGLAEKSYDSLIFVRDDQRIVSYTVYYLAESDLIAFVDSEEAAYKDAGAAVQRTQIPVTTDTMSFTTDIIGVNWGDIETAAMYGWSYLGNDGVSDYYLFVQVYDGYMDETGSKSADITAEEFTAYLNAVSPSRYID